MSNHSKAWQRGVIDHKQGISRKECPYPENSMEYQDWKEGWNFARDVSFVASDPLKAGMTEL
jgi:ribosome modulation factor